MTHPELAKQAVDWDPASVSRGSDRKKIWKCPLGHLYDAAVSSRVSGTGCPICAGKKILHGFNDLASINPTLALEVDGWDPKSVTANSNLKKKWRCKLGHVWIATVGLRNQGTGCPYCSGNKVLAGFNDFATKHPEIAKQAVGWDPTLVSMSSNAKKLWRCDFGHEWNSTINDRHAGHGCPYCHGLKVLPGFNDLLSKYPDIAIQAVGWDPSTVTMSANIKKLWRCELNHEWIATVSDRKQGYGCPYCSGNKVLRGFNDLASKYPYIASEAVGWDPSTVTANSSLKKLWSCELGHEWQATVSNRVGRLSKCPFCSGNKVLSGFNDLATKNPNLAAQAFGWDPRTVSAGSSQQKLWRCENGHQWKAGVKDRSFGNGCPTCAVSGFDPNSEGWLYFLTHPHWQMLQIGITNFPNNRLKSHKKLGWDLIELRGPMDGLIAREWETSILQKLKRHGAKLGPEEVVGKFDGYTEAWLASSFEAKSLQELIDIVRNDEG